MTSVTGRWVWRKSSYSNGNGNSDCVEIGHWRKSSFSEANGNSDCVEVGFAAEVTGLRDSKNPDGGLLTVPATGWESFRRTLGGSAPGPQ
jgi:hypothetical protein